MKLMEVITICLLILNLFVTESNKRDWDEIHEGRKCIMLFTLDRRGSILNGCRL